MPIPTFLRTRFQKISSAFTPKKRAWFLHESLLVVGLVTIIVVIVQLVYPSDRTLPFTKVADVEIGSLTKREAIDYLFQTYSNVEMTVSVAGKTIKTTTDKAGVLVDFQKAADATARYPLWQRFVPFSLYYKAAVINAKPEVTLDDQLVEQFVKTVKSQCDKPAREAAITIKGSEMILLEAVDGRVCTETNVKKGLKDALFTHGVATASIKPDTQRPNKSTAAASTQLYQAKVIITSGLTVAVANKNVVVPKEVIASWIVFTDDPTKSKFDVALSDAAIRSYLDTLKSTIAIAPIPLTIHLLDGEETLREAGQPGRDLDYDGTIAQIKQALLNKKSAVVTAKSVPLQPPLRYLRNYSKSQYGLERLLADIAAQKGNYGISVIELGGMGRSASANGGRKYVTASTYKLFVAYMVLKDLESGKLKWEDVITDGLNVRQCFEEMIVRSANRCAVAYIGRYGAGNIVSKMHELGFSSVEHNSTWWATVNDMAQYMKKLERGELLQGESREFLLGLLKRQIWRYGIPTGISSVTVADKVGFLEDYIHDVAIVYSSKGTYILAIMTKGGSYGGMADVARQVHRYLME